MYILLNHLRQIIFINSKAAGDSYAVIFAYTFKKPREAAHVGLITHFLKTLNPKTLGGLCERVTKPKATQLGNVNFWKQQRKPIRTLKKECVCPSVFTCAQSTNSIPWSHRQRRGLSPKSSAVVTEHGVELLRDSDEGRPAAQLLQFTSADICARGADPTQDVPYCHVHGAFIGNLHRLPL